MLKTFVKISILLYFKGTVAFSAEKNISSIFPMNKRDRILMKNYLKVHKEFSVKLCPSGTEENFWQKYKGHTKGEHFVPTLPDKTLDKKTIKNFIPLFKKKAEWIEGQIKKLESTKTFDDIFLYMNVVKSDLKELLDYKNDYHNNTGINDRKKILIQLNSERKLIRFTSRIKNLLELLSFLHNYKFPVDHFELRKKYDELKNKKDVKGKRKANKIYFYRKIVEDGTYNDEGRNSDKFLRALIDSLYIRIDKERYFLTENMRYDLSDFLRLSEKYLRTHGPSSVNERLQSWQKRVANKIIFFQSISKDFLRKKRLAQLSLKKFVLDKLTESYVFWTKKEELLRALFVLDTILFNEVGRIDRNDGLERKDIIQVVLNRLKKKQYNSFDKDDPLLKTLKAVTDIHPHDYPWLNVMLKEGEFSFSYFFITGNVRIYCPDMSQSGRSLREENIKLALELLRKPRFSLKVLRYFSRASMLGRVNMETLWKQEGYRPLEERPGSRVKNERELVEFYKKNQYHYLYKFIGPRGKTFWAVLIKEKVFVMPLGKTEFYHYRNPHFFRYFVQD